MSKYLYVHKDNRQASSEKGTWFAIKEALGEKEADDIVTVSETGTFKPLPKEKEVEGYRYTSKMDFVVGDEVVGTFYK